MDMQDRMIACERENARLSRALKRQRLLILLFAFLTCVGTVVASNSSKVSSFDVIEARELVVRDGNGMIRARVSGDMPDAVIDGKRVDRGQGAGGFMVYDAQGQERGGYVTFEDGNVALTLDSKKSQAALFVAGPDGGAAAEIWDGAGQVGLRVDEMGPRLTATRNGALVYQVPEVTLSDEVCAIYKDPGLSLTGKERLSACMQRFATAQCTRCLSE